MAGFDLRAKIGLDGSGFQAGLQQIERSASRFSSDLNNTLRGQVASAFAAVGLSRLTRDAVNYSGKINDLSARLGVSTKALQQFDLVAKQNGSSIDSVAGFFEKLASSRRKALEGSEEAQAAFAEFGVSLRDLQDLRIEDIGGKIAKAFKAGDPQKLVAPLKELGGRGASELIPTFTQGFSDIGDAASQAGGIIKDELIVQMDDLGDRATKFGSILRAYIVPIIGWIADRVEETADYIKLNIAPLAAMIGNFSQTFSLKDAAAAGRESFDEILDRRIAREREREEKRKARDAAGKANSGGDDGDGVSSSAAREMERERTRQLELEQRLQQQRRENMRETLSDEKKRLDIQKEIAELQTEIDKPEIGPGLSKNETLERQIKIAEMEGVLGEPVKPKLPDVNQLQRIGAFAPSVESPMVAQQKQSNAHLEAIKAAVSTKERGIIV